MALGAISEDEERMRESRSEEEKEEREIFVERKKEELWRI